MEQFVIDAEIFVQEDSILWLLYNCEYTLNFFHSIDFSYYFLLMQKNFKVEGLCYYDDD